jgi:BNR repeat-containing family member
MRSLILVIASTLLYSSAFSQPDTLGLGWSKTSINTVIFRKNSLVSHNGTQYASWYDTSGHVTVASKNADSKWNVKHTAMTGNVKDAHNTISMMVDGDGFIHLSWDHHNNPLRYAKSISPGSLEFTTSELMMDRDEQRVSYPEFYRLPSGNLLFLYRNGESGKGNLVINQYDIITRKWTRVQDNLIDGENERNAYWQAFVSADGTMHISWVWREDPDVATNHDMCYARSRDGGITWEKSNGERYSLPINASNAEYALKIPQQSDLINQTSMAATSDGHPVIATYWRQGGKEIPQFFIIYHDGSKWNHERVSNRKTSFTLKGAGTKIIPVSRPQVIVSGAISNMKVQVVYRDNERKSLITLASRGSGQHWRYRDFIKILPSDAPAWEPTYDSELFRQTGKLVLFVQNVGQGDGEKVANVPAAPVVLMTLK